MQIGSTDSVRACSSVRLERTPDKREVDGSIPSRPTMSMRRAKSIEQRAQVNYVPRAMRSAALLGV